ncbi:MAG: hypothetical protein C4320_02860 [Armatimonadota bacterium]
MLDRIVCALDTGELDSALTTIRRFAPRVTRFKIGHALTLAHGLGVIGKLQDAGADQIFLDLKFHDIPNSVAIAVEEAARRGVWMLTVHVTGGSAMLRAAREAAGDHCNVIGVGVLTSLDDKPPRRVGDRRRLGWGGLFSSGNFYDARTRRPRPDGSGAGDSSGGRAIARPTPHR